MTGRAYTVGIMVLRRCMKRIVLLSVFLSSTTFAQTGPSKTGPFGFYMGMPNAELSKLGGIKDKNGYIFTKAPIGNDSFVAYLVATSEKTGVCKVAAVSKSVTTSSYGEALRKEFDKIHGILNEKYGSAQDLDFLRSGSIWKNSNDWMYGLLKKERTLLSVWDLKDKPSSIDGLSFISLDARAESSSKGYVLVTYEMSNFKECQAELKKNDGDGM